MQTLKELSTNLQEGKISSRDLIDNCLAKFDAEDGQGPKIFTEIYRQQAIENADKADQLLASGSPPTKFTGIPISTKDLFDIAGSVTRAGSVVLAETPAAQVDAEIIRRLKSAGFIIIGRTNMTEFAYSGLGINPHYGTPLNPFERYLQRIPGGSSSGAAISVTDDMAAAAIGTDTGGSCRIPAAFCGLVGFKPTAKRVPLDGTYPLSKSFDSVGPIGRSVECCRILDEVLSSSTYPYTDQSSLNHLKLGVLRNFVLDEVDEHVSSDFDRALAVLMESGVEIEDVFLPSLNDLPNLNARGGIIAAEAYGYHKELLEASEDLYDPRVSVRIKKALEQSDGEYANLLGTRQTMILEASRITSDFDAVIFPTTPMIAPLISDLEDDGEYGRVNLLALRNPTVANFLDRCAISIPMHHTEKPPTGLMIMGENSQDAKLFSTASMIETALNSKRH